MCMLGGTRSSFTQSNYADNVSCHKKAATPGSKAENVTLTRLLPRGDGLEGVVISMNVRMYSTIGLVPQVTVSRIIGHALSLAIGRLFCYVIACKALGLI